MPYEFTLRSMAVGELSDQFNDGQISKDEYVSRAIGEADMFAYFMREEHEDDDNPALDQAMTMLSAIVTVLANITED